jgi:hypothetical protein
MAYSTREWWWWSHKVATGRRRARPRPYSGLEVSDRAELVVPQASNTKTWWEERGAKAAIPARTICASRGKPLPGFAAAHASAAAAAAAAAMAMAHVKPPSPNNLITRTPSVSSAGFHYNFERLLFSFFFLSYISIFLMVFS